MAEIENRPNRALVRITSTIGILLAVASFEHGLFEALQGFKRADGMIIQAIGKSMRWWEGGTEEAFTLIPNYLLTGLVTMALSLTALYWSIKRIDSKNGPRVFLLLFLALTLVGGGIGHLPFFILTWAFATRIDKPLTWWTKRAAGANNKSAKKTWMFTLAFVCAFWLLALEIAIFGYFPGLSDSTQLLYLCWSSLLASLLLILITYILGLRFDARKRSEQSSLAM